MSPLTPVFLFDRAETFWPVGVEESLAATRPGLVGPNGPLAGPATVERLDEHAIRIDFPRDMRQPAGLAPVGYHRVVQAAGLHWHQFWLWYLYNPWDVLGVGKHEGDWEFVQTACTDAAGDHPVLMTCSQHHTGAKREFWSATLDGGRPLVYVARGSHANYFTPVDGPNGDHGDGRGKRLDTIEWRPFGAWATWNGRWGNSTGEGKSPESPGRQRLRWTLPHLFHSQAH